MLSSPLDTTIMHYAQFAHLQPEYPCEECLTAAIWEWRANYEQDLESWRGDSVCGRNDAFGMGTMPWMSFGEVDRRGDPMDLSW